MKCSGKPRCGESGNGGAGPMTSDDKPPFVDGWGTELFLHKPQRLPFFFFFFAECSLRVC